MLSPSTSTSRSPTYRLFPQFHQSLRITLFVPTYVYPFRRCLLGASYLTWSKAATISCCRDLQSFSSATYVGTHTSSIARHLYWCNFPNSSSLPQYIHTSPSTTYIHTLPTYLLTCHHLHWSFSIAEQYFILSTILSAWRTLKQTPFFHWTCK